MLIPDLKAPALVEALAAEGCFHGDELGRGTLQVAVTYLHRGAWTGGTGEARATRSPYTIPMMWNPQST